VISCRFAAYMLLFPPSEPFRGVASGRRGAAVDEDAYRCTPVYRAGARDAVPDDNEADARLAIFLESIERLVQIPRYSAIPRESLEFLLKSRRNRRKATKRSAAHSSGLVIGSRQQRRGIRDSACLSPTFWTVLSY
jgi:hypothetical protein